MSWLDGVRHRLGRLFRPGALQEEVEEEFGFHLDLDAAQVADDTRVARRFGNRTWYREEVRRQTLFRYIDPLRQDLSYTLRALARSPGFAIAVASLLALGIGVNAAIFTLLDRLYFRYPSGIESPATLRTVYVQHFRTGDGIPFTGSSMSYPAYQSLRRAAARPDDLMLFFTDNSLRMGRSPTAPKLRGTYASASYFTVLGVRAAIGRVYSAEEDRIGNGARVVVVAHRFWRRQLEGDTAALGRTMSIGRDSYTIIGVLPPEFTGLDLQESDVWLPLSSIPPQPWIDGPWWESDNMWSFRAVKRSTSRDSEREFEPRATIELRASNRQLNGEDADTLVQVYTGSIIEARGPGQPGQDLIISTRLAGVALIVLAIACSNLVNLLLARAVSRRREIAVRLALGISRRRLVWLLSLETLVLAGGAGIASLLAASWGGNLLRALLLPDVEWYRPALDTRVALFAGVAALLAGAVTGAIPAFQASHLNLAHAFKAGSRLGTPRQSRLRRGLVVIQAALTVMLLVGGSLFLRSLRNVQAIDIGYDADRLLFGSMQFTDGEEPPTPAFNAGMRRVIERLKGRTSVEAVAGSAFTPMWGFGAFYFYTRTDSATSFRPPPSSSGSGANVPTFSAVTPGFFRATGIRLLSGNTFSGSNSGKGSAEVIVNQTMAKLVWPGRDPLGECIWFEKRDSPCYSVVGVVETVRRDRVIEPQDLAQFYLPLDNLPGQEQRAETIIVRAAPEEGRSAAQEVKVALHEVFPAGLPTVTTMTANLEGEYRPWRLGATLFSLLGLLALLVAVAGFYSTTAYGVGQRTHEFGVRKALGARMPDVLKQVVGEGLRTVALGVILGAALSILSGRLIVALLYGVEPTDPSVLTLVSGTLLLVAALASLVPAWRATRVDPMKALAAD